MLHAALGCTANEYEYGLAGIRHARRCGGLDPIAVPLLSAMDRGGFVGIAVVVDSASNIQAPGVAQSPWAINGQVGWKLAEVQALTFVRYKGALSMKVPMSDLPLEYHSAINDLRGKGWK